MRWPGTDTEKSCGNAFDWNTGERSIFSVRDIGYAKISREQTQVIERNRAVGIEPGLILGMSHSADERARQHRSNVSTQTQARRLVKKVGKSLSNLSRAT